MTSLWNHQVGRNQVRWGFEEDFPAAEVGCLARLICSSVLFMPSLPRQLSPISLISNVCLSPGLSSSCWKDTQVSSILNKAPLDLTLSPIFCTAPSLNTHNSVGTVLSSWRPSWSPNCFNPTELYPRAPIYKDPISGVVRWQGFGLCTECPQTAFVPSLYVPSLAHHSLLRVQVQIKILVLFSVPWIICSIHLRCNIFIWLLLLIFSSVRSCSLLIKLC